MSSLLPQFRQDWSVNEEDLSTGMRRVAIGSLMAGLGLLMAGGLHAGAGVDALFGNTSAHFTGIDVWFLIIGYGFQLFFSFAGWSHLMIGAARLFGIQLQENFNRPYLSTTPSMFWTRWHMSLSFWIRDFLFLPLATARREAWWRNLSLVIAMFVFGLWHGGTVLYMMWGIYHGILMVLHRQWQEFRKRVGFEWAGLVPTLISWAITFSAVSIGYIFFNAKSFKQAFGMLKAIASPHTYRHLTLDHSFCRNDVPGVSGIFRGDRRQHAFGSRSRARPRTNSQAANAGWLTGMLRNSGHRTMGMDHACSGSSGALPERNVPTRPRRNRPGNVCPVLALRDS